MHQDICSLIPGVQATFDAGIYAEDTGLALIANLAKSAPNDPSQFAEGFTNYRFGLFVGASPAYSPSWHFVAGIFNQDGISTDLQYTDPLLWFDVLAVIPYFSTKADLDADKVSCYGPMAPFDDHLKKITLPILSLGAAGGTGKEGFYSVHRTGSTDVTMSTIQFHGNEEATPDFGHADLFTARSAETLAWQPILDWLVLHP